MHLLCLLKNKGFSGLFKAKIFCARQDLPAQNDLAVSLMDNQYAEAIASKTVHLNVGSALCCWWGGPSSSVAT